MAHTDPPVVLDHVTKTFGTTTAVDSASWAPGTGRVTALVGLNGAGKSTLMRLVTGLTRPTAGTVTVNADTGGRALSAMVEAPALFTGLTAARNLAVHRTLTGADPDDVARVADLTRIEHVLTKRVGTLSQGYRQRVAIAVALLGSPRTLLLDEPTSTLDPEAVVALRGLIRRLADEGTAVIVSTHQLRELEGTADALTLLHDGRIRYDGPFDAFVGRPRLRVRTGDEPTDRRLLGLLRTGGIDGRIEPDGIHAANDAEDADRTAHRIFGIAAEAGIGLVELGHVTPTLEEAFHLAVAGDPS